MRVQCTIAGAGALPLPVCHIRATRPAEATYKQNPLCDNMPAVFATCPTSTSDTVCALQPGNPATNVPTLAIRAIVYLCNVSARAMYAAQSVVEKTRLVTPTLLSRDDFTDRMYVRRSSSCFCVLCCCVVLQQLGLPCAAMPACWSSALLCQWMQLLRNCVNDSHPARQSDSAQRSTMTTRTRQSRY